MRVLGEVIKVTRSRNFLVKLKPPLKRDLKDMKVISEDLTLVGVVSDIIGPVHEPYALVKILVPLEEARKYLGKKLYLVERKEESKLIKYPDS
ncbi:MAG: hypothetical protein J7L91_04720 [Candidatus Korarchaeota archaeon]|nr:hypothetical protein [Candidatus Korarchaeota archaeon]